MENFILSLKPIFEDFSNSLSDFLSDELKSSILLIDRRNNIMNYMTFIMPHITNKLILPLGLYKKIVDEKETLGEFRDWRFKASTDSDEQYKLTPPELLVHMRDTCFHLDQFLETPSNTGFNKLFMKAYQSIYQKYLEELKKEGMAEAGVKEAGDNMMQVFQERFAFLYNKSLTSFQIGNMIEMFLSMFMSYLGSNAFYQIEGLFDDKLMNLDRFKKLFYEYRTADGGKVGSLPITLKYFLQMTGTRRQII